jgi:hypothetical protein
LIKADFQLGHVDEAKKLAWSDWNQLLPRLAADRADIDPQQVKQLEARAWSLEDIWGQYWFGDPHWFAQFDAVSSGRVRLRLLASYARGALRNSATYQEPI